MARKVYLMTGVTPNYKNNTHYIFDDDGDGKNAYIGELTRAGGQVITTVDIKDYRIVNNNLIISAGLLSGSDPLLISYVVDVDNETNYFRCYYTRNCEIKSDLVFYNLELDIFATYCPKAQFRNMHVKRCNRFVGVGIYDPVANCSITSNAGYKQISVDGFATSTTQAICYLEESETAVLFSLSFVIRQNLAGTDVTTTTKMFGCSMKTIRDTLENAGVNTNGIRGVELANALISGINKVPGTGGTFGLLKDLDATVMNIYILPTQCVEFDIKQYQFKSHTIYTTDEVSIVVLDVKETKTENSYRRNLDKNYKWYFGTLSRSMELTQKTQTDDVYLIVNTSFSRLNVTIRQGAQEIDITDAFTMQQSGTAQSTDALQKIGFIANKAIDAIITGVGIYTGNVGVGAYGVSKLIGGQIKDFIGSQNRANVSTAGGGGDASFTYGWKYYKYNNKYYNVFPLLYIGIKSVIDEEEKARRTGVAYDLYMHFDTITNYELLGTGSETRTYLEADAEIDGVPTEAIDYIKDKFNAGIYYVRL